MTIPPPSPLSYEGQIAIPYIVRTTNPPVPSSVTNQPFAVPTIWINKLTGSAWILTQNPIGAATWLAFGGGGGSGGLAQNNIFYVSTSGNDTYAGTNINLAVKTFGQAIALANAQLPSPTNRFAIVCLDDAIYPESITLPSYVDIFAPNATLGDTVTGGSITCNDNSDIKFYAINVLTGSTGVFKAFGSIYCNVDIDIVTLAGTAVGVICLGGLINFTWKQMYVDTGSGIGDLSSALHHIHLRGGDIYINGVGGLCIANASTGYIVGSVDHCLDNGGTGTAISISSGFIDLYISKIENATAYTLNALTGASRLNLFCNDITGATSVINGAYANVWTNPSFPVNQAGMNNGQLVIGSTGLNPVVANLSAGGGISIVNGPGSITISSNVTYHVTPITFASSPYTVLSTDEYLSLDTTGGPIALLFPNAPTTGTYFTIKDKTGTAATNNVKVTTVGGSVLIDGINAQIITSNYQSMSILFDGTSYEVF